MAGVQTLDFSVTKLEAGRRKTMELGTPSSKIPRLIPIEGGFFIQEVAKTGSNAFFVSCFPSELAGQ